jgi:hypothetical protein
VVYDFCLSNDYHYYYFCWSFEEFSLVSRAPFIRQFISSFIISTNNFISSEIQIHRPPPLQLCFSLLPLTSFLLPQQAPSVGGVSPTDQTGRANTGWRNDVVFVFAVPGFSLMYN